MRRQIGQLASAALALQVFAPVAFALPDAAAKGGQLKERRQGEAALPSAATEGPRDLTALTPPLATFVKAQPFGKDWKDVVRTDAPPTDRTGLGAAETHPDLKKDPIEMQAQAQFLEEARVERRYGWVSIRLQRAYRYGKLTAVHLVLDRVGATERPEVATDLAALADTWKDPLAALGLSGFKVARNDLVAGTPGAATRWPLRIVIEPSRGQPR